MVSKGEWGSSIRSSTMFFMICMFVSAGMIGFLFNAPDAAAPGPDVDYIVIRDAPNGGGNIVGDRTYLLGDTDTFYAAGYNYSSGYVGEVYADWWSYYPGVGYVDPDNGSTSVTFITVGYGMTTVYAFYHEQGQWTNWTGTLTVFSTIDSVIIRTAPSNGGEWVGDSIYYVGDTDTFFAAGYNYTHGYQGDFAATWTSDDTSICTVSGFGVSTTLTAKAAGTCKITADYGGKTNETGALTVKPVITVDDSGGADYLTIQEAIDAALPGEKIFVYNGTYYENVVVYKSVRIRGEDRNGTIIDGSGSGTVVLITANEVEIEQFTIRNGKYGIFLDKSEDSKITYSIVRDYEYGIYNNYTIDCYIAYNEITNGKYGIVTYHASNDAVRWNIISLNTVYGAKDFNSQLRNCFNWNKFYHNKIGYWYDPTIELSELEFDGNVLEYNEIGVKVSDASTVRVTNNTIKFGDYGIYIENASPWIYRNNIESNRIGLFAFKSSSRIEKNTIAGTDYGLYARESSPKIIGNSIEEASIHTIYVESARDIELIENDANDMIMHNSTAQIYDSVVPELSLVNTDATIISSSIQDLNIDQTSSLTAKWYLTIMVEDADGQPVDGADVRILDYQSNEVDAQKTGLDGKVGTVALTEYVLDSLGQIYQTPHTIIAEKGELRSEEIVTMSENKYIELTIKMPITASGIPWLFLIVIGSITALGVGGLMATEVGKYAFISLFIPLYMKLKKESVLEHYERGRVYQYVAFNPGEHYNSIKKGLGLNNGALTYHLHVLEKANKIKSRQDGIYKRFYPFESIVPQTNGGLTEVQKRIVNCIQDLPDASQKELASVLGVRQSTLSYQLAKLESSGVIESVRERRSVRYVVKTSNEKHG